MWCIPALHSSRAFTLQTFVPTQNQPGFGHGAVQKKKRVANSAGHAGSGSFDELRERNQLVDAVNELDLMIQQGSHVDSSVLYGLLKRCIACKDLSIGRRLHVLAIGNGCESNVFLANHLIRMYAAHAMLEEATNVFDKVARANCHMWASIILAHARHGHPDKALELYRQMQRTDVKPNNHVFVAALAACSAAKNLAAGREVHVHILEADSPNLFVGNCLVDMYAKCGRLDEAYRIFSSLPCKNIVTWNTMIGAYAQSGLGEAALILYDSMPLETTLSANCVTFTCLLQACGITKALLLGKKIHCKIREQGLDSDTVIRNCLVSMYAKCGSLEEANKVFWSTEAPNCHIWASIISAHVQHGQPYKAVQLYQKLRESPLKPSTHILSAVLKACTIAQDLSLGRELHADISRIADVPNVHVGNCLVDMYAKCGSLQEAQKVFDSLMCKDVETWNAMIAGYALYGFGQEALALHIRMQDEGITPPNSVTFACLLHACASCRALLQGRKVHIQIQEQGLETDVVVGNCLLDMYAKCGDLESASRVFDALPIKDVITWTAMISGYVRHGCGQKALALYASMQQEGRTQANHVTFVCLLQACAGIGALLEGKEIHSQIRKQCLEADVVIGNGLVNMYAKCGSLEDALLVFNKLPSKDVVTWTAMIAGYAHSGNGQEALNLYEIMEQEGMTPADAFTFACLLQACGSVAGLDKGKEIHARVIQNGLEATDLYIASCLIDMYSKCGSMGDAQAVLDALPKRDTVTWNTLIAGYAHQGESGLVFELFHKMRQEGVQPNSITFLSLLSVCSHVGLIAEGVKYFEIMNRDYGIIPTVEHCNCMIDLLGRAGQVEKALQVLKAMPCQPASDVWRSILSACLKWHRVELGLQVFEHVVKLDKNDGVPYVLMSNIYAAAQRWEAAKEIRALGVRAGAWKTQGQCWWTDTSGNVHTFAVEDRNAEMQCVFAKLKNVFVRSQEENYKNCSPIPDHARLYTS